MYVCSSVQGMNEQEAPKAFIQPCLVYPIDITTYILPQPRPRPRPRPRPQRSPSSVHTNSTDLEAIQPTGVTELHTYCTFRAPRESAGHTKYIGAYARITTRQGNRSSGSGKEEEQQHHSVYLSTYLPAHPRTHPLVRIRILHTEQHKSKKKEKARGK